MAVDRQLNLILDLKDRASKDLKSFRGRVQSLQPAFQKMALGGTVAFAGISTAIGKSIESARRAQDIESLFSLAFDDTEDRARKFVSEFSDQFGRAESTVKDSVARVAFNLQKASDVSEDEMFKMSTDVQKAAEGLALLDVNIDSAADVSQAFADSLAGQNQQLSRMIGGLREEDIERRAVIEGIIEEGDELNRNQRARALYLEFMKSTPASQEKMEQKNRGLTDTYIQFQAALTEVQEVLGNQFLPILNKVLQAVMPVIKMMGDWIEENPKLARNIILATLALAGLIAAVGTLGLLLPTIIFGFALLAGPIGIVIGIIGSLAFAVRNVVKIMQILRDDSEVIWEGIKIMFKNAVDWIMSKTLDPLIDKISSVIDSLKSAIDFARQLGGSIGNRFTSGLSNIGSAIGVNDAVITPQGQVIKTDPADYLFATKNPENMRGGVTVNVSGNFLSEDAAEEMGDKIIKKLKMSTKL